jgi:exodeoxyribonuclease VII large subunit
MEDLWPFDEPSVEEAILACSMPVISAVGHETDFSISDFVADLRAPTPSAAAELAVPERSALISTLSSLQNRLQNALKHGVRAKRDRLSLLWGDAVRLRMQRAAEQRRQTLDETHAGLFQASARMLETQRNRLEREKERLLAYSPQRTLERGFALIGGKQGHIIASSREIETGDTVSIRFADGTAQAKITGKETV